MAGFQAVWSIDVGKSSLKAVRMQRDRNHLEIAAVDKVNYRVDPDGIDTLHQAKDAIRTFASRNVINCPIIASHPGHAAFSRFIQLPPVDAKKLQEMIGYEAQQQIPFPIDEVIWDYHVCADDSLQEKEVGIFAVRSEVISDFMLDYENAGMSLSMISIGYLGLLNYVLYDLRPKKPAVVLDIGAEHTDLLVVDGKRFWIRNLGIAGKDITEALQDKFKLQFHEAEKLKMSASKSEQAVKIFSVIQPNLKELVNEIHRSVGFYKSQAGEVKFAEIYLVGSGARLLGLGRFLQEQLRFKVHVPKGFHRLRVSREANVALLQGEFSSFAAAVGNGIQALDDGECNVNLMPKEQQAALEFQKKRKFVIASAASLILLVFYLAAFYNGRVENADEAYAKTQIVGEFDERAKSIRELEEKNRSFLEKGKLLERYASNRRQPYLAIKALQEVFAALNTDLNVIEDVPLGQAQGNIADQLEAHMDTEINPKKFWLCNYVMDRVLLTANGEELPLRGYDPQKKGAAIEAFRISVDAMCDQRSNNQIAKADVEKGIVEPLEMKLTELLGQPPEGKKRVALLPSASAAPPDRLHVPTTNIRGAIKGSDVEAGETQGTFFQFELKWYHHADPLPSLEEEKEEEEPEEKPRRGRKKRN